ncbi:MAG: adenosylcobinamide-GDP ribazoletransferase [Bacteroidales bacterium]|nr:adenosylcobinamide-GDP ribazoletransferase [Bacteroidales bacterium]
MPTSPSIFDRIWAALLFFTRLPLWRLHQPSKEAYATVVEHWPLTGWLTGGVTAAGLYLFSLWLPWPLAIVLAIALRMLLTGALHEDGLADFFDGFGGGGGDRQRILSIMKDSHIGTYGVLGLVVYLLTIVFTLLPMVPSQAVWVVLLADPFAKLLAANMIVLPYARSEETAKSKVVYRRLSGQATASLLVQGLLPLVFCLWQLGAFSANGPLAWWEILLVVAVPMLVSKGLFCYVRRRLGGYTGDCCGAVFLLTEASVLLTMLVCLVN